VQVRFVENLAKLKQFLIEKDMVRLVYKHMLLQK